MEKEEDEDNEEQEEKLQDVSKYGKQVKRSIRWGRRMKRRRSIVEGCEAFQLLEYQMVRVGGQI